MRLRCLKAKHWLIITIMGMLGLAACSEEDSGGEIVPMYGIVETTYHPGN